MNKSGNSAKLAWSGMRTLCALMVVFSFPSAPTLAASLNSTVKIHSHILKEDRTISIVLPEEYHEGKNRYSVLYVLDAESPEGFQKVCSSVKRLSVETIIPPLIVVGIWNPEGKRNRDMIPAAVSHRPGSGGSRRFLQFIRDELMTHVKNDYRTSDTSILYGGSNAGLFTVYAMLEDSEVFNAGIAGSPMIGHCPAFMQDLAEDFVVRNPKQEKVLFMIYGSEDSNRVTDFVPKFQEYLEKNAPAGFKTFHVILKGEGHVPPAVWSGV